MSESAIARWLRSFPKYQLRYIIDQSRFQAIVKARQIGMSHGTSAKAVLAGLNEKRTQLILSASQALADEVLHKARCHCEILSALGHPRAMRLSTDSATEIAWQGGGRIISLPSNPRTARSFSGDVHLDEAAYHSDLDGIRDAVFPMVSRPGFRLNVISTPNGAQGLFHKWITQPLPGWKIGEISIDHAEADGFEVDREALFQSVAGGDERLFAQWFKCQFVDADLQYFPSALIERAKHWDVRPSLTGAEIFAGLDVGRDHDLTALTICALLDGILWVFQPITCKRTSFKEQKAMIRDARRMFRWKNLHVDRGGLGRQLSEELVEEYGSEIIPFDFTRDSKEDLVTRALRWFRDEKIRFPKGKDGDLLATETLSCRRTVTAAGNVIFDTPRNGEGHGDRFWSMCLALWGAGEPAVARGYGQQPLLMVT